MTCDDIEDLTEKLETFFEAHEDESIRFKNIKPERRLSNRRDIHAFILLDRLVPGCVAMVSAAEHDIIYLEVKPYQVMQAASEEDLLDLIRCGICYDSSLDSFYKFV